MKIVLGAGLQLVDAPGQARMVTTILPLLSKRDQGRVKEWAMKRELYLAPDTSIPEPTPQANTPAASAFIDPIAVAVMHTLGRFDSTELSLIEGEFLNHAEGEDRALVEELFGKLSTAAQKAR